MSRKTVLSRPRTRLYDANYNIGESYYKSAIDRLDRKYSGRPLESPPRRQSFPFENGVERNGTKTDEEDLETKKEKNVANGTDKRQKKVVVIEEVRTKKEMKSMNGQVTEHNRKVSKEDATKKKKISFADEISDRHTRFFGDEDLETSRKRASKHIQEQHLFDSRGALIGRRGVLDNFENGLNDETTSIRSIRASQKSAMIDDVDLENTSNNLKSHRLLNRSEKILDSVGINDTPRRGLEEGSYRRKAQRVTFEDGDDVQKWSPLDNQVTSVKARREEVTTVRARKEDRSAEIRSESSAAAMRARQSKEKLNDIEEEMAAIAEKQAAREARVARLRALVAETEQESEAFERSQSAAERRSARKEIYES